MCEKIDLSEFWYAIETSPTHNEMRNVARYIYRIYGVPRCCDVCSVKDNCPRFIHRNECISNITDYLVAQRHEGVDQDES